MNSIAKLSVVIPVRDGQQRIASEVSRVLEAVADGMTNQEIGLILHISEHTVANHLKNIFAKIGVTNRVSAASYTLRKGLGQNNQHTPQ